MNKMLVIITLVVSVLVSIVLVFSLSSSLQIPPSPNSNISNDLVKVKDNSTSISFGIPTDNGSEGGMTYLVLDNPEKKISFRFTAKYSGEAQTLVFDLVSGNDGKLLAGLQADDNGKPSGEWLGKPGVGKGNADANGFIEIRLQGPAPISEGKIYHFVIQTVDPIAGDNLLVKMYDLNSQVQPLNDNNLDILWPDPEMNTLYYDGRAWLEENHWPIFVIKYSDRRSEGVPYSLAAPWVIYGSRYVGQEIIPSSNYIAKEMGFSVALSGQTPDKLYYEVRDSANKVLAKGVFAEARELSVFRKFIKVQFDSPLILKKDQIYRLVLLSPGTDLNEPYHIYGHEFAYDSKIGYGGLRHILTISYDAGSTWQRWDDADTIFSLTVINKR